MFSGKKPCSQGAGGWRCFGVRTVCIYVETQACVMNLGNDDCCIQIESAPTERPTRTPNRCAWQPCVVRGPHCQRLPPPKRQLVRRPAQWSFGVGGFVTAQFGPGKALADQCGDRSHDWCSRSLRSLRLRAFSSAVGYEFLVHIFSFFICNFPKWTGDVMSSCQCHHVIMSSCHPEGTTHDVQETGHAAACELGALFIWVQRPAIISHVRHPHLSYLGRVRGC
jgi:hypothetical protein